MNNADKMLYGFYAIGVLAFAVILLAIVGFYNTTPILYMIAGFIASFIAGALIAAWYIPYQE